jgi:hypothetical protein
MLRMNCDKKVPTWLRRSVISIGALLFIVLGVSTVYRAGPYAWNGRQWGSKHHRTDFSIYTAVGQAILDGKNIYEVENPRGWHYNNAPVFGLLFIPLALIPLFWAALIWYLISVVVVAMGVWCCVQLSQDVSRETFWLYVVPLVLLASPVMSGLARGQLSPVLFGLAMAGVYCEMRGRSWLGGALLGGAVLMKIFPVFFVVYYIWQKRWKGVVATGVAVFLGALVIPGMAMGWQRNLEMLKQWGAILRRPTFEQGKSDDPRFGELISPDLVRNQSLQSVLKRVTDRENANVPAVAAGIVMAALMLAAIWRGRGTNNRILLLSALISWALLMSPVSWNHYFILLVLPLAVLTMAAEAEPDKVSQRVALVALILFGVMNLAFSGNRAIYRFGPLCWGTLVVWGALMMLAFRKSASAGKLSASATT